MIYVYANQKRWYLLLVMKTKPLPTKSTKKRFQVIVNGKSTGTVTLRDAREIAAVLSPSAKITDQFGNTYPKS